MNSFEPKGRFGFAISRTFAFDHLVKPDVQHMTISSDSERKILEAARKEFEKKGYSGTRMQKIADEAGISKASLHYYFRSKDNLFKKIFDDAMEAYLPLLNTWTDNQLDWEQKIRQFIHDFMKFSEQGHLLFLIREINRNPELLSERIKKTKSQNRFVLYFEQVMSENKIRHADVRILYIILQSICCFPALNGPMFQKTLRLSNIQYQSLMAEYAHSAANFFIHALKAK